MAELLSDCPSPPESPQRIDLADSPEKLDAPNF